MTKLSYEDLVKFLKKFAKDGEEWEKKSIATRGDIKVVKKPKGKLALTINSDITDFKSRRDMYTDSCAKMEDHYGILTESMDVIMKLLKGIEEVNGKTPRVSNGVSKDALEI